MKFNLNFSTTKHGTRFAWFNYMLIWGNSIIQQEEYLFHEEYQKFDMGKYLSFQECFTDADQTQSFLMVTNFENLRK